MKAYSDINQSKLLAEILPLESADMIWFVPADNEGEFIEKVSLINNKSEYNLFDKVTDWNDTPYLPCWSLAALLDILSKTAHSIDEDGSVDLGDYKNIEWSVCLNNTNVGLFTTNNPVDACYQMIIKLHEQNLL